MTPRTALIATLVIASIAGTAVLLMAGGPAVQAGVAAITELAAANRALGLAVFAAWSIVVLALVIPTGSVTMIAAGFLFGALEAAAVFFAMMLPVSAALYVMARDDRGPRLAALIGRHLPQALAGLPDAVRAEGTATVAALRLNPLVPSAVLCLAAPSLGIGLGQLMAGTLLAGWVRPVLFASAGEAVRAAGQTVTAGTAAVDPVRLTLVLGLAGAATAVLAVRLWRRMRTK